MESISLSNDNYNKCAKELTETNSKTIINQINMLNIDCDTENHLYTMDEEYQDLIIGIYENSKAII